MDRGTIVRNAFYNLGDTTVYNDNRSEKYEIANRLLDNVVKEINTSKKYTFNSSTIQLNTTGRQSVIGETEYVLPSDYLNIMAIYKKRLGYTSGVLPLALEIGQERTVSYRLEKGFIYANVTDLVMQYKYKMLLENYPPYMEFLVTWNLSFELAKYFPEYKSYIPVCLQEMYNKEKSVIASEPRGRLGVRI